MSRAPSPTIIARQEAKTAERTAAVADRFAQLAAVAPNANPADIKYIAIMCGSNPMFPTILRLLASQNGGMR